MYNEVELGATMTQSELLANFRAHQLALDAATEQKRPHSYLYRGGGHCPFHWHNLGANQ